MKLVMEQQINDADIDEEDGGRAKIAHFTGDDKRDAAEGLFVKIQSWSESGEHVDFDAMIGKRVRVTVEVLD